MQAPLLRRAHALSLSNLPVFNGGWQVLFAASGRPHRASPSHISRRRAHVFSDGRQNVTPFGEILRHLSKRPSLIERLTNALIRLLHDPVVLAIMTVIITIAPVFYCIWVTGLVPEIPEVLFPLALGLALAGLFLAVISVKTRNVAETIQTALPPASTASADRRDPR